VDYLFAYDATTGVVDDYQYAMLTDAYLLDHATRDFIRKHNPNALREIGERLLEAMQRGMWKNPGAYRGKVEEVLLLAEEGVEG
ncbi:MAG: cobaltochelatase subunit CobN, partial [Gammaproteobacteria bacterium]|nr:cobaltochelatase subunit CobN [Gammaproteobacteria bacterium]